MASQPGSFSAAVRGLAPPAAQVFGAVSPLGLQERHVASLASSYGQQQHGVLRSLFGSGEGASTCSGDPEPGYDLVVIGAGIAGIAAARAAHDAGLRVVVLEARDRIGGRIHTAYIPTDSADSQLRTPNVAADARGATPATMPIDIGAAWIHGTLCEERGPNPLILALQAAGCTHVETADSCAFFNADGTPVPEEELQRMTQIADDFEEYQQRYVAEGRDAHLSLEQLALRYAKDKHLPVSQLALLLRHLAQVVVGGREGYAGDLRDLAALFYQHSDEWGGPDALPVQCFGPITDTMASGIDIRLSEPVLQIDYRRANATAAWADCISNAAKHGHSLEEVGMLYSSSLVAKACKGTGGGSGVDEEDAGPAVVVTTAVRSYRAKYALVTLPLAYLQAHGGSSGTLFEPPLPHGKLRALNELGIAVLNKVIMIWDEPWMDQITDKEWIVVQDENDTNALVAAAVPAPDGCSPYVGLVDYFNVRATQLRQPMIVCFTTGAGARGFEALSDAEAAEAALEPLRRLVKPPHALPPPKKVLVTRWASDPWALGSYSFGKVGMGPETRRLVAAPVGNGHVLFAGEHTHEGLPATVHGAYLSGLREAAKVVAALRGHAVARPLLQAVASAQPQSAHKEPHSIAKHRQAQLLKQQQQQEKVAAGPIMSRL